MAVDSTWLKDHVREIPDFPRPGVGFKDLTPLLGDRSAFAGVVRAFVERFSGQRVDKVLGIEARGFIFAGAVAVGLDAGFVPVRKAGKLPWEIEREEYDLEYGTDRLEIHRDAIQGGERVLVVDDVLATGGTAAATVRLVEKLGGEVAGVATVAELAFLEGRSRLVGHDVVSLITYD